VGQRATRCDPAGMAEAIEALFARDQAPIKAAARRRAEQRHTWDTTFEGLSRLYGELVVGRPASVQLRA
jgi:alpha-1,6-mannosyltransferase